MRSSCSGPYIVGAHAYLFGGGGGRRTDAYGQKGEHDRAIEDLTKALLELQPDVPAVLDVRGRLLEALGRREEAIADFRRALARRPDLKASKEGLKRLAAGP